jgi:hypothetical protein
MVTPLEQLDAMLGLGPNWDGYDAAPIAPAVVALAKEFVALIAGDSPARPDLHVTPGRDGGVLIEWADATHDHELEINPDGSIGFVHEDRATGDMVSKTFGPTRLAIQPELLREVRELVAA